MTTTTELELELEVLIRRAIGTRAGETRPGRATARVVVTLSPALLKLVSDHRLKVPREVDGLPVSVSERPAQVHKPSGRYMCTVMARGEDVGSSGFSFLAENAQPDLIEEQARERARTRWWR